MGTRSGGGRAIPRRRRGPRVHAAWPGRRRSRRGKQRAPPPVCGLRGSVRKKLRELESLVPGAEGLGVDQLFVRTADYIFHLKQQVHVLHAISKLCVP